MYFCEMRIKVICIGKTDQNYLIEGEQIYLKRLMHYMSVEKIEIPDLKKQKNLSRDQIKQLEGKEILNRIHAHDAVFLLDERGKMYSSIDFSEFLQQQFNLSLKNLVFVIGGAYGFSDEVYVRANGKISLSKLTFSHQMVRLFFIEQLYRGLTILRGEPYHHE
jgi:23S rRNA (pseudouridine1915-N3)-methyltransferase